MLVAPLSVRTPAIGTAPLTLGMIARAIAPVAISVSRRATTPAAVGLLPALAAPLSVRTPAVVSTPLLGWPAIAAARRPLLVLGHHRAARPPCASCY